jgi:hypothetical protein
VATFLDKAAALKRKGPLALMSGDLKLLTNQIKQDSAELRAQNQALEAAGKRKLYCTPAGFGMDQKQVLQAMENVPAPQRASLSTRDALRAYLAQVHPCR